MFNISRKPISNLINLGLGDYLEERYPHFAWHEHLEHVLVLCHTHIWHAWKKQFPDHVASPSIDQILHTDSLDVVKQTMRKTATKHPETAQWFKNKDVPWILAGITPEASKMSFKW